MYIRFLLGLPPVTESVSISENTKQIKDTYRAILGLAPSATDEQVKQRYMQKYCSLKVGYFANNNQETSEVLIRLQIIQQEYEKFLDNPDNQFSISEKSLQQAQNNSRANTKFINAAKANYFNLVKEAVAEGADVCHRPTKSTVKLPDAVWWACKHSNVEMLQYLLAIHVKKYGTYDFTQFFRTPYKEEPTTALKIAIANSNPGLVKAIIYFNRKYDALTSIYARQIDYSNKTIFPELYQCNDQTFAVVLDAIPLLKNIPNLANKSKNKARFLNDAISYFFVLDQDQQSKKIVRLLAIIKALNLKEIEDIKLIVQDLKKFYDVYPNDFINEVCVHFTQQQQQQIKILLNLNISVTQQENNQQTPTQSNQNHHLWKQPPNRIRAKFSYIKTDHLNNNNNNNHNTIDLTETSEEQPITYSQVEEEELNLAANILLSLKK